VTSVCLELDNLCDSHYILTRDLHLGGDTGAPPPGGPAPPPPPPPGGPPLPPGMVLLSAHCRLCSTSADVAPVGADCVVVPNVEAAGAWVVVVVLEIV